MNKINDLQAGKAGEYLVCADLILKGYIAYPSEQGLHYDIVVDDHGKLIRVQVKTTRKPKAIPQRKEYVPAYRFNIRRMGKNGRRSYTCRDVDMFALVALDTKSIGYISESQTKQTMDFRLKDYEGLYSDEKNIERREEVIRLRDSGMTYTEIGNTMNIDRSQAHRIYKGEGTKSQYRYLEDLSFEDALNDLNNNEADAQAQPPLL